jgi:hypothetical protein
VGEMPDQGDPGMEEPLFYSCNHKEMQCHHYCHGDWVSNGVWPLRLTVDIEKASWHHPHLCPQTAPKYKKKKKEQTVLILCSKISLVLNQILQSIM